uniref:hypothetical protein n=1 Tax=Paracoccus sp. T5 TaxID=3402161 RepID=UPI003AE9EF29
QATPRPVIQSQNSSRSNKGRSPVFPDPQAFPPSVKRYLGPAPNGRNRKMKMTVGFLITL